MRHLFSLLFLSIAFVSFPWRADSAIVRTGEGWILSTGQSTLMLRVEGLVVYPVYFGATHSATSDWKQYRLTGHGSRLLEEVPVRGGHANKLPIVEAVFPDGTRDIELELAGEELLEMDGRETLRLTFEDKEYPLEVVSFIRVYPEYDLMEKWIEVRNLSRKRKYDVRLDNLMSGSFLLRPGTYHLTHHSGKWAGEFSLVRTELTTGVKTLMSSDFTSFENTSWFCVNDSCEPSGDSGEVWFGQVEYDGNWRVDFAQTPGGSLQIVGGINFWDTSLTLLPGESFTSPGMIVGCCVEGEEGAMRRFHSFIRNEVQRHPLSPRPVLYNSWYATEFNINEKQQLALAQVAKDIGVELFVIDDGWFKGRKSDKAGLGDWTVDPDKFPHGLSPLIDGVHSMGMKFGIWVEPEMVNPDSDLYRIHPDWVLNFPNRTRTESRNQLMLNLARQDVYEYLLESMTRLLRDNRIDFVKWDRNRALSQPGWPGAEQPESVRIRYMDNLYRLLDTLQEAFPYVIFENCSSGGGRPGLGMIRRSDQTWASDNTDPLDRLFIQYGYLSAWPASSMVCWTNGEDHHAISPGLEFIFDVAMQGVLGIGQDITLWGVEEKDLARRKITFYKEHRDVIQNGTVYRLLSPYSGRREALEYVSPGKDRALLLCYDLAEFGGTLPGSLELPSRIRLKGLDPSSVYEVSSGGRVTGAELMGGGLPWPVNGSFKSSVITVTKLDNQ